MKKFNAENMSPKTMEILNKAINEATAQAGTKHERLYLEGLTEELSTSYASYGGTLNEAAKTETVKTEGVKTEGVKTEGAKAEGAKAKG